jgi:branched-chain amino acid transport system permease protein
MPQLTRGSAGLFMPVADLMGIEMKSTGAFYLFALALAVLAVLGVLNLMRSRVGRAFLAIREQDIAAEMMGIHLARFKLLAFAISAFYTGIAGALFAYQVRYINVDSFGLLLSIEALGIIIVGGLGSVAGAVIGTVFMTLLPEGIRILFDLLGAGLQEIFSTRALELRGLIYGAVIILVLRFQPEGLIGIWREVRRIWTNWPFRY